MCQFCEPVGFNSITNTVEYSGLEISINKLGLLRVRDYNFKDIFEKQDIANINYCPMCGTKFKEE